MKKYLAAALLAVAPLLSQATDWIWSNSEIAVVVSDNRACTNQHILKALELAGAPKEWKWGEAKIMVDGQTIQACAAVVEGKVIVIDENGQGGVLPVSGFHKLKDA